MDRTQILNALAVDKSLDKLIAKMCSNNRYLIEEGKSELFIILCELPEAKLLELYNGEDERLMRWISGVLKNFYQRKSSPFYQKIIKPAKHSASRPKREDNPQDDDFSELIIEDVYIASDDEETDFKDENGYSYSADQLEAAILNLPEFDKRMINLYLEQGTYRKMARKLNLNVDSIRRSVKRIKGILHETLKKDLN
jgi:DNA-directed RNA polymerase specialized sigma24 family protein